jgi:glutamine amidotransferase
MIAIVDYGAGNVRSVMNVFEAIGPNSLLTNDPDILAKASAIVLPGVGAFGDCMKSLRRLKLVEPLNELVLHEKKPYLGICLGMQFLGRESCERGVHRGLGWIQGKVELLVPKEKKFRIPHMGWNDIYMHKSCPLFEGLEDSPVFYFVHSYHLAVDKEDANAVTATCWHGTTVTAAVQKDNIFGTQFHPEKSQKSGIKLLKNFLKGI